jgi:non-lysosomal glucosylceramidase
VLAMGLAQHGFFELAQDTVAAVRERFDGARRNPFDEAECGHHYARALASWGVVVALTGFGYDARSGVMSFAAADPAGGAGSDAGGAGSDAGGAGSAVVWFWAAGSAWGTVRQSFDAAGARAVALEVLYGSVRVERVLVGGEEFGPAEPGVLVAGFRAELRASELPG